MDENHGGFTVTLYQNVVLSQVYNIPAKLEAVDGVHDNACALLNQVLNKFVLHFLKSPFQIMVNIW